MKQIGLLDEFEFGLRHVSRSDGQRFLSPFWNPKYDYLQEHINEI